VGRRGIRRWRTIARRVLGAIDLILHSRPTAPREVLEERRYAASVTPAAHNKLHLSSNLRLFTKRHSQYISVVELENGYSMMINYL